MSWASKSVVILCLISSSAAHTTVTAQELDAAADFALSGMQSSLEKLVSGVYRASGTIDGHWHSNTPVTMEWTAYSSFDYSKSLMRFDFNEDPSSVPNTKIKGLISFKRKIARTSDYLNSLA